MGLSHFFRVGLYYTKQTKYLGYAVGGSAILNLPLNLALIPTFGAMGAAWATLISFAILALATFKVSQRIFPIRSVRSPPEAHSRRRRDLRRVPADPTGIPNGGDRCR